MWFGGVSRFQFSYAECPECNGTGLEENIPHPPGEEKMWQIDVDKEKCSGCSECVDNCPGEVYELIDNKAEPVNIDECHGCHTCEELCESDAIVVKEE